MSDSNTVFTERRVAIVGVGLLGGSVAAALRQRAPRVRISGVGLDENRIAAAQRAGLLDAATTRLDEAAAEASLIIVCTPVDRIADLVTQAAESSPAETLITDVGSVKQVVCEAVGRHDTARRKFIGSHPMAGSEKAGFEHARADLFVDTSCIICPQADDDAGTGDRLTNFWQFLGARVTPMSPAEHDRVVASISHLPHAVAAALALVPDDGDLPFSGAGYRDTTRVAAGDADLWTPILASNREALLERLERFDEHLSELRSALRQDDPETEPVRAFLARAQARRAQKG